MSIWQDPKLLAIARKHYSLHGRLRMFFLTVFLLLSVNPALAQDELMFRHLSVETGLSQNIVYCMVQDKQGYIWMGTQNARLNRYDGYNNTVFTNAPFDPFSLIH